MILKNQNKRIEISSSILNDVYDTGNKSVTIVGKKNCCAEFLNKKLEPTDLINTSVITAKDSKYHPFQLGGRLQTITLVNTKTNQIYDFNGTGKNLNTPSEVNQVIVLFKSFTSGFPEMYFTEMEINVVNNDIEIIISNLPYNVEIFEVNLATSNGDFYFGEVESNPVFYPYQYMEDGIYDFTLKSTDLNTNGFVSETKCIAILDDIKCLIPNNIINNKNTISHLIYQSIMNVNDCNCMCEDMCNLYNSLIEEVKWT